MKDLYNAIDALKNIVNEAPPGGNVAYNSFGDMVKAVTTPGKQGSSDPKQSAKNIKAARAGIDGPAAAKPKLGGTGVGRQDGPAALKPATPAPVKRTGPVGGPTRANAAKLAGVDGPASAMAGAALGGDATAPRAAPKPNPAARAGIDGPANAAAKAAVPMPKPRPAAAAPRKKVKATAANTKDFDKTMALQKKLQAQGFDIKADGIMGKNTRAAMAKAAGPRDGGNPAGPAAKAPAPTGTARKVSTVAPTKTASTPMDAGEFSTAASGQDAAKARVARSNAALAKDFKKVKDAGSGILDKITGGISSLFKPSPRSAIGKRGRNVARSAPSNTGIDGPATPNAAGSNFASAADGSISRTDNPRQPGDATRTTRTTRTASMSGAPVGTQSAGSRGRPRRTDTSFRASDGENTVTRDASGNLNVRQRVTDPDAKAALLNKVNNARDRARAALAAGSTDPDDIRAYQRRMANVRGTGVAGGTDPNTF